MTWGELLDRAKHEGVSLDDEIAMIDIDTRPGQVTELRRDHRTKISSVYVGKRAGLVFITNAILIG